MRTLIYEIRMLAGILALRVALRVLPSGEFRDDLDAALADLIRLQSIRYNLAN